MLVVGRKEGESVRIGDEITVRVVRLEGTKCRLGIAAPRHVRIVRSEIVKDKSADEQDARSR